MNSLKEKVIQKIEQRPEPQLHEVLHFVELLSSNPADQEEPLLAIAGILSGESLPSDDIDRELYGGSDDHANP
ncbi:MAG: DUF2281 domain-containing protein [Armatimonadetes bacterium]|nr:DUF2281 domain-containing protein [Armatimonadota bacterium]